MIVSAVDNGDARMPVHEEIEDLIAIRNDSGAPQSLFNDGGNDGYRLRPADQRIFELARVHFHDVGLH